MNRPKKSLGQHWLSDKPVLESIAKAADLQPADTVLEIGPGPGSLTELLAAQAGWVIAIELDAQLAKKLKSRSIQNLKVVHGDILQFDFTSLPPDYKIVANIPYYLTGHLLRTLTETTNPPKLAVLLVQKEVAQRIAAQPGQMSIISTIVQLLYEVKLGRVVPAKLFEPPPKVDSQIIALDRRPNPLFKNLDNQLFFQITKAGFASRRKKLRGSLSASLQISKDQADELLQKAKVDPNLRAQNLSLKQWHAIYRAYSKN